MSDLTVKELEVVRDIPGNPQEKGGPAKVMRVLFEGDDRKPEMFTTARTTLPSVGDKIPEEQLRFNEQWSRWEIAQPGGRKPQQGFKRSPEESKRIVRQHSQDMALRLCAILGYVPDEETFANYVNWFDDDVYGKLTRGSNAWPMTSDVPADDEDLPTLPFEEKPER
jgi:hypothetical protein